MLKTEDFKCDNCDGAGKSPYEMYRCKECDGEGYSDYKILNLIHTESLETVLAGIEIIKAMKEGNSELAVTDNINSGIIYESGKWIYRYPIQMAMEPVDYDSKDFDSPLSAITALLGDTK